MVYKRESEQLLNDLLDKYLSGEASADEVACLHRLYDQHQKEESGSLPLHLSDWREEQWEKLQSNLENSRYVDKVVSMHPVRQRKWRWNLVAAAVAVVALTSLAVYAYLGKATSEEIGTITLVAKEGEHAQITLPDGTIVHLNAKSTLSYPSRFDQVLREVNLSGEAYFDVVKNPEAPFIIKTEQMDVQVLGTTLNVKAYPGDKTAETALLTGSVRIISKSDPSKVVVLKPNQKYVERYEPVKEVEGPRVRPASQLEEPKNPVIAQEITPLEPGVLDDLPEETEWIARRLTIRNETLEDIVVKLERMYGVKIQITNPRVAHLRYSAKFVNEELINALKSLQEVEAFNFRKEVSGKIIIY